MNYTKTHIKVWIAVVIILVLVFFASGCAPARGPYADGRFQGTSAGHYGDLTVEVLIENGNIQDIQVIKTEDTDGILAGVINVVIPDIINGKSTEGVDTLTGATGSSQGVIGAVSEALAQATLQ